MPSDIEKALASALAVAAFSAGSLTACGSDDAFVPGDWAVEATVQEDGVRVAATIASYHTDFIHMSIRRMGWDSQYTLERSPATQQPDRDWSRVHHWFGELHPDTYLEGRIDDGSGRGPATSTTFQFTLPRMADLDRQDFPDEGGSAYTYITSVYAHADGQQRHPDFGPGAYEIEIYPWYTGRVDGLHPAIDDSPEVQYLHYEVPLASTAFVIE